MAEVLRLLSENPELFLEDTQARAAWLDMLNGKDSPELRQVLSQLQSVAKRPDAKEALKTLASSPSMLELLEAKT